MYDLEKKFAIRITTAVKQLLAIFPPFFNKWQQEPIVAVSSKFGDRIKTLTTRHVLILPVTITRDA